MGLDKRKLLFPKYKFKEILNFRCFIIIIPIHYPGLLGENSEYVKLVSNDNHEFVIRRELAEISMIPKKVLRTPDDNRSNTVYLHMINSRVLSKMCNYLSYHKLYLKKEGAFEIDPRDGYEFLLVAGFFKI
ncbi:unnamed protein product [Caenorhabditis brenneri]